MPLTARDAAAPDVGDVLALSQSRTDDPLAGVIVPASTVPNPVAGTPSHIQQTYAQLVSALPVNDTQGQTHAAMPTLTTEQDYHDYIRRVRRRGQRLEQTHRRKNRHRLPVYLAGDPTFDAGLGRGRQHDEAIEFSACTVIGVLAFLRSCSGVGRHAQ